MTIQAVILAAGKGTRMRSSLPKVLHPVANKPMVAHVIEAAQACGVDGIHLVYGHGAEQLKARIESPDLHWAHQAEQLGTGHAVAVALPDIADEDKVLVLYGDTPLLQADTLQRLIAAQPPVAWACSPSIWPTPPAMAASCGRTARSPALSSKGRHAGTAGHHRGEHRCAGGRCRPAQGLAGRAEQRQCSRGVLPHRHLCHGSP
ncbi:NTP transferase domain-containing protein [Oceanimonas sp. NS1]|nr:NTP transferase domain-containing protein [Oceanimonas sp. NS1]